MSVSDIIRRACKTIAHRPFDPNRLQTTTDYAVVWNDDAPPESTDPLDNFQFLVDFEWINGRWHYRRIKYFDPAKYRWTPETHWQIIHENMFSGQQLTLF